MLRRRPIDEIKESLVKDSKSEADVNKLKMIFKENPLLRQIPPNQRGDFCVSMRLHVLSPLEVFLTEKAKKPDLYIILDGKVFIRSKAKQEYTLEAYEIFGYTLPFNGQKWAPSRVTSRDSASIISIPRGPLKRAMEKVKKVQDNTKLLEFLVKTVPGVRQLGQAGKERVLGFFERFSFKSGDVLLREGERAQHAYIIEEGECKIVGSQNPLKRPGSAPARGLISKTTSCFNLGVVMPGEWVGEDSILMMKPLEFSVIAASHLNTLRITREKFLDSLTRDTQNLLKESLGNKIKWRELRKQNIEAAIMENVNDEEGIAEVAAYEDAEKNYPKASKLALVNIRKQEAESSEKIQNPVESNHGSILRPSLFKRSRPQTGISRPFSAAVSEKRLPIACTSNASSKNLLYSQPLFEKSTQSLMVPERPADNKIQLYSAFTLGYSLVPTISKRPSTAVKKPELTQPIALKPAAVLHISSSLDTFAQRVRKGRPPSPNPAEVWARKQGVDLMKYNLLSTNYT